MEQEEIFLPSCEEISGAAVLPNVFEIGKLKGDVLNKLFENLEESGSPSYPRKTENVLRYFISEYSDKIRRYSDELRKNLKLKQEEAGRLNRIRAFLAKKSRWPKPLRRGTVGYEPKDEEHGETKEMVVRIALQRREVYQGVSKMLEDRLQKKKSQLEDAYKNGAKTTKLKREIKSIEGEIKEISEASNQNNKVLEGTIERLPETTKKINEHIDHFVTEKARKELLHFFVSKGIVSKNVYSEFDVLTGKNIVNFTNIVADLFKEEILDGINGDFPSLRFSTLGVSGSVPISVGKISTYSEMDRLDPVSSLMTGVCNHPWDRTLNYDDLIVQKVEGLTKSVVIVLIDTSNSMVGIRKGWRKERPFSRELEEYLYYYDRSRLVAVKKTALALYGACQDLGFDSYFFMFNDIVNEVRPSQIIYLQAKGGTNTQQALFRALEKLKECDAENGFVYMLTDGQPTIWGREWEEKWKEFDMMTKSYDKGGFKQFATKVLSFGMIEANIKEVDDYERVMDREALKYAMEEAKKFEEYRYQLRVVLMSPTDRNLEPGKAIIRAAGGHGKLIITNPHDIVNDVFIDFLEGFKVYR